MEVHSQSRTIQSEGTRPHHHLCELRRLHCLCNSYCQRNQDILQEGTDILSSVARRIDHAGARFWLGGDFPAILGRAGRHVVAAKSDSGLPLQVTPC